MKMKPVVEGAMIRDPFTKMPLPAEGGDVGEPPSSHWTRRWLAGETWRLEGSEWVRRTTNAKGEVVLVRERYVEPPISAPTGAELVTPITTRKGE